jgi:hypothetical protein
LANREIGRDNDSGSAVSGANGLVGVAEVEASGVDVGAGAGAGAGAVVVVDFAGAVVVVVAGAVVGVVSFNDGVDGSTLDVAAPAGPRPASTLAPPSTRAPLSTTIDKRGFRLKVLLLLFLCMGYTDPH